MSTARPVKTLIETIDGFRKDNTPDLDKTSALEASYAKHHTSFLGKKGKGIDYADTSGLTPLICAVNNNDAFTVNWILNRLPKKSLRNAVNRSDNNGNHAYYYAQAQAYQLTERCKKFVARSDLTGKNNGAYFQKLEQAQKQNSDIISLLVSHVLNRTNGFTLAPITAVTPPEVKEESRSDISVKQASTVKVESEAVLGQTDSPGDLVKKETSETRLGKARQKYKLTFSLELSKILRLENKDIKVITELLSSEKLEEYQLTKADRNKVLDLMLKQAAFLSDAEDIATMKKEQVAGKFEFIKYLLDWALANNNDVFARCNLTPQIQNILSLFSDEAGHDVVLKNFESARTIKPSPSSTKQPSPRESISSGSGNLSSLARMSVFSSGSMDFSSSHHESLGHQSSPSYSSNEAFRPLGS